MLPTNNPICSICKQKNHSHKLKKLQLLEQKLQNVKPDDSTLHYHWFTDDKCKYGLSCPKLKQTSMQMKQIIHNVEPKILTVIKMQDDKIFHEILQICHSDFTLVYKNVEKLYNKEKNKHRGD